MTSPEMVILKWLLMNRTATLLPGDSRIADMKKNVSQSPEDSTSSRFSLRPGPVYDCVAAFEQNQHSFRRSSDCGSGAMLKNTC